MNIERIISDEVYEAGENANAPGQLNPFATEVITNGLQIQLNALAPSILISGGVSYSGIGFVYDVSALIYRIQGTLLGSVATQVTLGAADPTFDRIDVIYANTSGTVGVIAGTPAASPVKPVVNSNTQLEISFVTVGAGATAPVVTIEDIYLEDAGIPTEWNGTSGFGANFADTTSPHTDTKHIDTNNAFGPSDEMRFTPAAPYTINGGNVSFWLSPQASLAAPGRAFNVGFFVSGVLVGNAIQIGGAPFITYGFDPLGPLNVYQLVTIPITVFGALPTTVDEVKMYKPIGPPAFTDMYIDDFQVQESIPSSGGGSIDASAVTYTPAISANWGPVPNDVAEALDQLATLTSVTNTAMLILTPVAGTQVYNTTWLAVYTYDGDVWLTPNLIKAINGNATAVMVEGNPVIQDAGNANEVSFSLAPTSQESGIVGVVKDTYGGPGSVGDFITIAISGEHNVKFGNASVSIGDSIFNSGVVAGIAFSSAGFSFGQFGIAKGAKAGGSSGLVKCWVTSTERF